MKESTKKHFKRAGGLLFYLYIILLSYFLFFSEHYGRSYTTDGYRYNLVFFKEIRRFIQYRQQLGIESFVVNVLGNVLAFTPFGFLLSLIKKKYRGFFKIMLLSVLFSFTVEVIQLILKVGIFDVDDILLNSIGGVFGYIIFAVSHAVYLLGIHKKRGKRGK